MKKRARRDSQVTELQGRGRLVGELLIAGLEVALPARDRGVDLVAYIDLKTSTLEFRARPVQMKAASRRHFSVSKKYARIRDLILAFVWHLNDEHPPVTYAMSYPDAVSVARKMGYTETYSWKVGGGYSTQNPSMRLLRLLEPHLMNGSKWLELIKAS
jgi:hypothetical protein